MKHALTPFKEADLTGGSPRALQGDEYTPDRGYITILGEDGSIVCQIFPFAAKGGGYEAALANAEFIVTACNNHDDLVAENKDLRQALEDIHKAVAPHKASGHNDYKRLVNYMRGRASAALAKVKP